MSLRVLYCDRIEELAEHLKASLLLDCASADPFDFPQVVVPNTNIAKWLRMRVFAKTPQLCAGIRFPFMEQRLTELLLRNLPSEPQISLLPDNAYANAIMATLLDARHSEFGLFAPFREYVSGGSAEPLDLSSQKSSRMAWQLATKLADLMDQYEVRRPEIVDNWLCGRNADGTSAPVAGSAEAGEAALARALWGERGAFPADGTCLSLRQIYDRVKTNPSQGPAQKIYFFGQSTLSLLQVRILVWLAQTHDVVFYHNNVCLEYWGDIETKAERIRKLGRAHADEEDISLENPLLQQWGVAGRETMRLLVELEEENDGRIDFEWECVADPRREAPRTVLGRIQESICHRTGEAERAPQDASLQIVGAPGVRREVELVYNAIIGSVWKPEGSGERPWPDCSFSDIAVLVPDMATYRPAIEAVFDARGDVPYGLVDTTASEDSKYLAGFMAIGDIARRGLSRETLFALLDNPCVQAALGFSSDDAAEWKEIAAAVGAFDGFDRSPGDSMFNWDWALSRLRLAKVADALSAAGGGELPLADVGGKSALRLSEVVELVYRLVCEAFGGVGAAAGRRLPCAAGAEGPGGLDWAGVFARLAGDMLAVPGDDALEDSVRRQILQTLNGLSSVPGVQGFEFVLAAVEHFAGGMSCRKGGYLTHGVTISGLQPMRPVPFRQVFVLGLGEGGFPGRIGSCGALDIRGTSWHLGDVAVPKVNRYLFLETLMSVRDRLVVTYPNRDIEKDAELFPSGIVRELEGFAGTVVSSGAFMEFPGYPLLEHGELGGGEVESVCDVSWRRDDPHAGILPTYSRSAREFAAERIAGRAPVRGRVSAAASVDPRREVSARVLADFLKSPFDAVLKHRFGIAVEGCRDVELEADSPLGMPDGPTLWGLEREWLDGNGDSDGPFRRLQLSGMAPAGFLGDFAKRRFDENVEACREALLSFAESFAAGGGASSSVLTTGRLADGPDTVFPPVRALEPLLSFIMHVARQDSAADALSLRVGVVDVGGAAAAAWRWSIAPDAAREYLERLKRRYLSYLDLREGESAYVDFTYRKLCKSLEGEVGGEDSEIAWEAVLGRLTAEEFRAGGGFNGNLVIGQSVEAYRRAPTAEELADIYESIYRLPLSGAREAHDPEGGAQ